MIYSFPEIIKQLRTKTGMSQKDFGLFLFPELSEGGAQNKIKRFEAATQEPLLSELIQLSTVLKISASIFLCENDDLTTPPEIAPLISAVKKIMTSGSEVIKSALQANIWAFKMTIDYEEENNRLKSQLENKDREISELKKDKSLQITNVQDFSNSNHLNGLKIASGWKS